MLDRETNLVKDWVEEFGTDDDGGEGNAMLALLLSS
jgi:hypothetical protein